VGIHSTSPVGKKRLTREHSAETGKELRKRDKLLLIVRLIRRFGGSLPCSHLPASKPLVVDHPKGVKREITKFEPCFSSPRVFRSDTVGGMSHRIKHTVLRSNLT